MKNIFVLVNPFAGNGRAVVVAKKVLKTLKDLNARIHLKVIKQFEKISDIIKDLTDPFDYLVIIGGDGTVRSAVEGILRGKKDYILGTYPGGSGGEVSHFAKTLSILSLKNALLKTCVKEIDVFNADVTLTIGSRASYHFVANLQIGHFAFGIQQTPKIAKKLFGGVGYMIGVLRALLKRENALSHVIGDKKKIFSGRIYTIHFGNMPTTRGGVPVAPLADPSDSKIDIMLAKALTKKEAFEALPQVLKGEHLKHPAVIYDQLKTVYVKSEGDHIAIDGEYLGLFKELRIRFSGKVKILCNH